MPVDAAPVATPAPRHRVAVMQPYFYPYAGYFRLFAAVDEFVVFDCVQFPRRGRVHRSQVPGPGGQEEWLTLPLRAQSRDVLIRELQFAADARAEFDRRLARFPWLATGRGELAERVHAHLHAPLDDVVGYLEAGLRLVADALGFAPRIRRSSSLHLDPSLRAQDRILAIAQACGATDYVNPPGGRELYEPAAFTAAGLGLHFLRPYAGRFTHLLPALLAHAPAELRADVLADAQPEPV
jgi:hypothetical protein